MLQEIDTKTITLSSAAAEAMQSIMTERKLDGYAVRVFVAGGGCGGTSFGMALDNNIGANDLTFTSEGISIVVDQMSFEELHGADIQYINDPERGPGFVVNSPNASKGGSCSCGNNASGEESSCACGGGSCGCGGH